MKVHDRATSSRRGSAVNWKCRHCGRIIHPGDVYLSLDKWNKTHIDCILSVLKEGGIGVELDWNPIPAKKTRGQVIQEEFAKAQEELRIETLVLE